jgi:multiple antibiotic resistance protein
MTSETSFFAIALALFLVINATGSIPVFLALLAKFDHKRQMKIITRELLIALATLLIFIFGGRKILHLLGISIPVIGMGGGLLLLLLSLPMIFPKKASLDMDTQQEPLIVPLAIPLVAGPGTLTACLLYVNQIGNPMFVAGAVVAAWAPSLLILLLGSYIKNLLGEKGLIAMERLGGMLICFIGIRMITNGALVLVKEFYKIGT